MKGRYKYMPTPMKLIHHGPATVVMWRDGTKTVTKLHGGDKYDGMVGVLNCVVRKLTRNHGHAVDEHEASMVKLAKKCKDVEGLRRRRDQAEFLLDVLDTAIAVYEAEDAAECEREGRRNLLDEIAATLESSLVAHAYRVIDPNTLGDPWRG